LILKGLYFQYNEKWREGILGKPPGDESKYNGLKLQGKTTYSWRTGLRRIPMCAISISTMFAILKGTHPARVTSRNNVAGFQSN
jgi:hypothetical protein